MSLGANDNSASPPPAGVADLHKALKRGNETVAQHLRDPALHAPNNDNLTPLGLAIREGRETAALFHIVQGDRIDCISEGGANLVHEAVHTCCIRVARKLLEAGI